MDLLNTLQRHYIDIHSAQYVCVYEMGEHVCLWGILALSSKLGLGWALDAASHSESQVHDALRMFSPALCFSMVHHWAAALQWSLLLCPA